MNVAMIKARPGKRGHETHASFGHGDLGVAPVEAPFLPDMAQDAGRGGQDDAPDIGGADVQLPDGEHEQEPDSGGDEHQHFPERCVTLRTWSRRPLGFGLCHLDRI